MFDLKDLKTWGLLMLMGGATLAQNNINSFATSLYGAQRMMAQSATRNNELQVTLISAENQAKIAEQRYTNGCLILLYKGQMAALTQGKPVYDTTTNKPLPKGTVVCDAYGLTAILEPRDFDGDGRYEPVITQEAFTGNSGVIGKALKSNRRVPYK